MGRLPATFGGRIITARQPQSFAGEVKLTSAQPGVQFPDATFLNSTDRPFEIHRMIPFVVAQDANDVALAVQPAQDLLMALARTKITDLGKGPTSLMKSPTLIRLLVKGNSERTWEWADPYYLAKSEQFQVVNDALTFPVDLQETMFSIKIGMNFEGFFITIGPPSDVR
jgi:hypothetical protein